MNTFVKYKIGAELVLRKQHVNHDKLNSDEFVFQVSFIESFDMSCTLCYDVKYALRYALLCLFQSDSEWLSFALQNIEILVRCSVFDPLLQLTIRSHESV